MNAHTSEFDGDETASLDKTLHNLREDLAAARVAAMQVLVFEMQIKTDDADVIPPEEFMQAVRDVDRARSSLREIEKRHLQPLGITLPEDLRDITKRVTNDLSELMRILDRCSISEAEGIRGFQAGQNMYELCCTRVAKGLNGLSGGIAAHFLSLKEKERHEELEKTNKIALEIGKIGRVINMVATNASIEAARVGDAGKGFTVIADEVKTLSTRVSSLSVSLTERQE